MACWSGLMAVAVRKEVPASVGAAASASAPALALGEGLPADGGSRQAEQRRAREHGRRQCA